MERRQFMTGLVLATALAATPALAEDLADRVVRQLKGQGFTRIEISRTWLGRTRIVATSKSQRREVILNPRTGEILRDYWHDREDDDGPDGSDGGDDGPDDLMDSRSDDHGEASGTDGGDDSGGGSSGGDDHGDSGGGDREGSGGGSDGDGHDD